MKKNDDTSSNAKILDSAPIFLLKKIINIFGKSLLILIFIILISLFGPRFIYFYERGIYYGYDLILEYKIAKAIDKVRQSRNFQPISLQDFSNKKIVRACVQSPYISQILFEEAIGDKPSDFNETSDHDGYLLWLFFLDGSTSRVRIPMRLWNDETMSYLSDNKGLCTEKKKLGSGLSLCIFKNKRLSMHNERPDPIECK